MWWACQTAFKAVRTGLKPVLLGRKWGVSQSLDPPYKTEEIHMYKKALKMFLTPVVLTLVFFITTTIAFGTMWYKEYSTRLAKEEAARKEEETRAVDRAKTNEALKQLYLKQSEKMKELIEKSQQQQ